VAPEGSLDYERRFGRRRFLLNLGLGLVVLLVGCRAVVHLKSGSVIHCLIALTNVINRGRGFELLN
jgi:hypothetical protein